MDGGSLDARGIGKCLDQGLDGRRIADLAQRRGGSYAEAATIAREHLNMRLDCCRMADLKQHPGCRHG